MKFLNSVFASLMLSRVAFSAEGPNLKETEEFLQKNLIGSLTVSAKISCEKIEIESEHDDEGQNPVDAFVSFSPLDVTYGNYRNGYKYFLQVECNSGKCIFSSNPNETTQLTSETNIESAINSPRVIKALQHHQELCGVL